uniref:Uncharacterized protein n=1 Tax=Solibacter usitatus (strain Ellin6076) TaxID=234267 RepID=Q02BW6_SOLUE
MTWGQTPAVPSWLVGYPGVHARTQSLPGMVESTYETEAGVSDVFAHYRRLFEGAGVDFHANFDGVGTSVRAAAAEGDVLIQIRAHGKGTTVRVDVAAKAPERTAAPAPVVPVAKPRVQETGREHVQNMEKFDRPVRPPRRRPPPVLVWPSWLANVDGSPLTVEKGVDNVGLKTLHCRYISDAERNAIQGFYAGLLTEHGFPVRMQSSVSWPAHLKGWLEASDHAIGEGPRIDIRIEVGPVGERTQVDIRMTARP